MKLFLSIVCALAVQRIEGAEIQTRVIGVPVPNGRVLYELAVITQDKQICTATLIDPLWAITSASCVSRSKRLRVRFEKVPTLDYITAKPVKDFYIHPAFNQETLLNDIALIELATPADLAWIPVEIPQLTDVFTKGVVSGYGHETGNLQIYQASVNVLALATCQKFTPMNTNKLCTGGSLSCDGDQGGPLVSENKLAGIVSIDELQLLTCSKNNPLAPIVSYTRVAPYRPWIKLVTKLNYL